MKLLLIALLFSISAFGQKKDSAARPTDSTKMFSFSDFSQFFDALQTKVKGEDGTTIQLTVKEYQLLTQLFNQSIAPAVQRWIAQHSK